MFSLWSRSCCLLLALAALFAAAPAAHADDDVKVKVSVLAILATDQNKDVDAELKCVAEKVQKIEPNLTGFHLVRSSTKSLKVGKPTRFWLQDDRSVHVTVEAGPDKNSRVGLTVKPPDLGEICYISCCGKYFPIVTRYQTKTKERLIIAIMVEPCAK